MDHCWGASQQQFSALVSRNVASLQSAPRVGGGDADDGEEMKILSADQQRTVLAGLAGEPLYPLVVAARSTPACAAANCWRCAGATSTWIARRSASASR
jgi:hypothetical protein